MTTRDLQLLKHITRTFFTCQIQIIIITQVLKVSATLGSQIPSN
jgi:hypothetical protein